MSLHRKNGRPVVYVVGELSGRQESPVYAILDMRDRIDALTGSRGEAVTQHFAAHPVTQETYAVRWDGEWDITRQVFRDLGLAFARGAASHLHAHRGMVQGPSHPPGHDGVHSPEPGGSHPRALGVPAGSSPPPP